MNCTETVSRSECKMGKKQSKEAIQNQMLEERLLFHKRKVNHLHWSPYNEKSLMIFPSFNDGCENKKYSELVTQFEHDHLRKIFLGDDKVHARIQRPTCVHFCYNQIHTLIFLQLRNCYKLSHHCSKQRCYASIESQFTNKNINDKNDAFKVN